MFNTSICIFVTQNQLQKKKIPKLNDFSTKQKEIFCQSKYLHLCPHFQKEYQRNTFFFFKLPQKKEQQSNVEHQQLHHHHSRVNKKRKKWGEFLRKMSWWSWKILTQFSTDKKDKFSTRINDNQMFNTTVYTFIAQTYSWTLKNEWTSSK